MFKRWETHRGDEWWFQDQWGKAAGDFAANIFSIDSIQPVSSQLTEQQAHELLWLTQQQISDATILVSLASPGTEQAIVSLSQRGLVEFQILESQYLRQARISKVSPFPIPPSAAASSGQMKKWWQW